MASSYKVFLGLICALALASAETANGNSTVGANDAAANEVQAGTKRAEGMLKEIGAGISWQLHSERGQGVNAIVATCLGIWMIYDGVVFFKYIVVICIFLLSVVCSLSEIKRMWGEVDRVHAVMEYVMAWEIGAIIALVAFKGFDGMRYMLGAVLGCVIAYYVHTFMFMRDALHPIANNEITALVVGNVSIAIGMWAFIGKGHLRVMAITSSLVGGALLSASLGYFFVLGAHYLGKAKVERIHLQFPEVVPAWIDFMSVLLSTNAQEREGVGLFAGSKHPKADWGLGLLTWAIFFFIGTRIQLKHLRAAKRKATPKVKATTAAAVAKQEPKAKANPGKGAWFRRSSAPTTGLETGLLAP